MCIFLAFKSNRNASSHKIIRNSNTGPLKNLSQNNRIRRIMRNGVTRKMKYLKINNTP